MSALQASLEAAAGRRASGRGSSNGGGGRSGGGANGRGRAAKTRGARDGDTRGLTVDELRKRAAKAGIEGRSKMTRKQLEKALS
jgi:hypothetical protein